MAVASQADVVATNGNAPGEITITTCADDTERRASALWNIAVSQKGNWLAAVTEDDCLEILSTRGGPSHVIQQLDHSKPFYDPQLAFGEVETVVAATTSSNALAVYELVESKWQEKWRATIPATDHFLALAVVQRDNLMIAVSGNGQRLTVERWSLDRGTRNTANEIPDPTDSRPHAPALLSADGTILAATTQNRGETFLKVYDTRSLAELLSRDLHGRPCSFALTPTSNRLLVLDVLTGFVGIDLSTSREFFRLDCSYDHVHELVAREDDVLFGTDFKIQQFPFKQTTLTAATYDEGVPVCAALSRQALVVSSLRSHTYLSALKETSSDWPRAADHFERNAIGGQMLHSLDRKTGAPLAPPVIIAGFALQPDDRVQTVSSFGTVTTYQTPLLDLKTATTQRLPLRGQFDPDRYFEPSTGMLPKLFLVSSCAIDSKGLVAYIISPNRRLGLLSSADKDPMFYDLPLREMYQQGSLRICSSQRLVVTRKTKADGRQVRTIVDLKTKSQRDVESEVDESGLAEEWSEDGKTLFVLDIAGKAMTLSAIDVDNPQGQRKTMRIDATPVREVGIESPHLLAVVPDKEIILCGDALGRLLVVSLVEKRVMQVLKVHDAPITAITASDDGFIGTAAFNGEVAVWSMNDLGITE
jgi:WD40 repeat protein